MFDFLSSQWASAAWEVINEVIKLNQSHIVYYEKSHISKLSSEVSNLSYLLDCISFLILKELPKSLNLTKLFTFLTSYGIVWFLYK